MLTSRERAELDELLEHYPDVRAAAVSVLKWLQARRGWLSDETMDDAADYLGLPVADLEGLATFYNLLFRRPVGDNVIFLCDSVSCWMRGYGQVRERLEDELGIGFGETTDDGRWTLLPTVCLGDCDHAPVAMIDDTLYRNLSPDRVDKMLELAADPDAAAPSRRGPDARDGSLEGVAQDAPPQQPDDPDAIGGEDG